MIGFRDRRSGRRGVSVASKKSKMNPNYKTRYKVRNWGSYDKALVRRGDLTIWLSSTAVEAWTALPSLKPGGQRHDSDVAIEAALMLRLVFGLPWRQTEGLLNSVLKLMELQICSPDHTTLSRRSRGLDVAIPKDAVLSHDPILAERNQHIGHRKRVGKRQWRVDTGHHQQARVENTFHRYKRTFGRGLRARTEDGQLVEVLTGCRILNRMLELGKPESIAIRA